MFLFMMFAYFQYYVATLLFVNKMMNKMMNKNNSITDMILMVILKENQRKYNCI